MTISRLTEAAAMTALFTGMFLGAVSILGLLIGYSLLFLHGVIG